MKTRMNKLPILLVLSSFLFLVSCQDDEADKENSKIAKSACGVKDPGNDLPWLKDIITKAEEDKITRTYKGNYLGTIYLETYKGQDLFFVNMMMGSGGLYGYVFRCDGSREYFDNEPEGMLNFHRSMKKQRVIYSTLPWLQYVFSVSLSNQNA